MADARMPDGFFEELELVLPAEKPVGRRGGRPRIPNRFVMKVIRFVLVTGCRSADVPLGLACSGRTAHRRLQRWYARGIWQRFRLHFLTVLRKAGVLETELAVIDSVLVRAFGGGDATGPSPVDRRKLGSKHTLLVDANCVPRVIRTAPANASDYKLILPIVAGFPEIGGTPGRPRKHPDAIYADRGYDSEAIRQSLRSQGIKPVIARRGTDHGSSLGRIRSVVERTTSWFEGLRRLRIRNDRSGDVQEAWNRLAASALCYSVAIRWGICPGWVLSGPIRSIRVFRGFAVPGLGARGFMNRHVATPP
jgi:transposase